MISTLITHVKVKKNDLNVRSPRLKYSVMLPDDLRDLLDRLKELVSEKVIFSQRVQTIAWKGQQIIRSLFQALLSEERLLTEHDRMLLNQASTEAERARVICDYIAGMTDSFAMRMYGRLYGLSRNFLIFDHPSLQDGENW